MAKKVTIKCLVVGCLILLMQPANAQKGAQSDLLQGRVLEAGSNSPVKNAKVVIYNADDNSVLFRKSTDDKGVYEIVYGNLRNFRIEVSKVFYESNSAGPYNIREIFSSPNRSIPDIFLKSNLVFTPPKIDTPLPQVLFERRVKEEHIFPNEDIFELIYALNPGLDRHRPIPSNTRLVMPKFPRPEKKVRKSFRKSHKKEVKPDKEQTAKYQSNTTAFNEVSARFIAANIRAGRGVSADAVPAVKRSLETLGSAINQFKQKASHTSKAALTIMNSELSILNQLLQKTLSENILSSETRDKYYAIKENIEQYFHVVFFNAGGLKQNEYKFAVMTGEIKRTIVFHPVKNNNASFFSISLLGVNTVSSLYGTNQYAATFLFSDPNDPRPFNIYVFINDPVTGQARNSPEEKIFDITYFPPGLEAEDPIKPGNLPASVSTASIPPAKFTFVIEDAKHNRTSYEKYLDQETYKDESVSWSLFHKRPYKLVFYLNNNQ